MEGGGEARLRRGFEGLHQFASEQKERMARFRAVDIRGLNHSKERTEMIWLAFAARSRN